MAYGFPEQSESDLTSIVDQKNSDRMIKQFLNTVIAKYWDLSLSLSLQLQQIIDLLATDKFLIFCSTLLNNYYC